MNNRNVKFLTEKEVRKIIDTIPTEIYDTKTGYSYPNRYGLRDRALLEVLFSSGLRISEALRLKVFDLTYDYSNGTREIAIIGKGKKQRVVYISSEAMKAVYEYLEVRDGSDWLFDIGPRTAQRMVKQRAKEAGMESWITPHKLRHGFACHLLKKGVSIYHLQRFLGHSNLNTTMVYLHASDSELEAIHKKVF